MASRSVQAAIARAEAHAAALVVRDKTLIEGMPTSKELALRGRAALAAMNIDPDERVSDATEQALRDARAGNTVKKVRAVWGRWLWWCGKTGRHHGDFDKPTTSANLREWTNDHWVLRPPVASRGEVGGQPYAYSSVRNAVYIVCMVHGWMGHASPAKDKLIDAQLDAYLQKWKRHAGYEVRKAFALPLEGSVEIARSYDLSTVAGLRNAAAFRMQWDIMGRATDLVADPPVDHQGLQRRHVQWEIPGEKVVLTIIQPKGGKTRRVTMQAVLTIEEEIDGEIVERPHPYADVDAVALFWRWWQALDAFGFTGPLTPVFHDVHSGYPRKDGSLAGRILESPWTADMYEQTWKYAVTRKTDIAERYAGTGISFATHMNRRGPINRAVQMKVPLNQVAQRSGHSKASQAIHGYYDDADQWNDDNPAWLISMDAGKKVKGGQPG